MNTIRQIASQVIAALTFQRRSSKTIPSKAFQRLMSGQEVVSQSRSVASHGSTER